MVGFTNGRILPKGYVEIMKFLCKDKLSKTVKICFLVAYCPTTSNILVSCQSLNDLGEVISTRHLLIKFANRDFYFETEFANRDSKIISIRGNQEVARGCYNMNLRLDREEGLKLTLEKC